MIYILIGHMAGKRGLEDRPLVYRFESHAGVTLMPRRSQLAEEGGVHR